MGINGLRLLVSAVTPDGSDVVSWTTPYTKFGVWANEEKGTGAFTSVKATVKSP